MGCKLIQAAAYKGARMVYDFLFINLAVYSRKIIPKNRALTSKARFLVIKRSKHVVGKTKTPWY